MANAYTQDIILDADGKPVLDALTLVRSFMNDIQKAVSGINVTSIEGAKKWQQELALNLKMLKAAESDLKTLQADRAARTKGFADADAHFKRIAQAEIRADKEANSQKLIEARVHYREKERLAREEQSVEKQLAKEIADFEREQDRKAIASSKEVAAARREAATAAVTAKARGITNPDDARAAKAASDQRLSLLRREREALASHDVEGARSVAARIQIEKALGTALDGTIRKLNQQTDAERRAAEAADRRFRGQSVQATKLLAGPDVLARAATLGATGARDFYKTEQAAAQATLRLTIASRVATDEQRVAAQKNLEIANARVRAAEQLVRQEERVTRAEERQAAGGGSGNGKSALRNILTPQYAATAFARTSLYGAAAGAAYGAFNTVEGGLSQVIEMEDELKKLQAIANATEPQLQQIKAAIYGIGENSRFSAIDLAKVSQTLAQAGVAAGEMENVLKAVTTLATASGSTPDEAVNLVTSALGSFQLQASEAARVADLMTNALNRTKLTVQQTGQAIQYVGATAYENNISLEQLLATVGAIAQAGVRSGSTIGTGLRQFIVDLQNPSEKLTTQLKALGLTAADVDISVRGLPAVIEKLRDSGFGAGQAYAGLETRAAAAYLVLKNNTDVMDQLQLSFAMAGASAVANERAMSSLTAQWTRFKNILAEDLGESLELPFNMLKEVLKNISDALAESRRVAAELKKDSSLEGYKKAYGDPGIGAANYGFDTVIGGSIEGFQMAQKSLLNTLDGNYWAGGKGWGDRWEEFATGARHATAASEVLATQVSDTTEAVDKQNGKISELDKEMARLIVQKETISGHDKRSAAEIATLTSRFEGLAIYLTNTGNRYDDLTNAVKRYRLEQIKALDVMLQAQAAALEVENSDARRTGGNAVDQIRNNPALYNKLDKRQKQDLDTITRKGVNTPEAQNAYARLAGDVGTFASGPKQDPELMRLLNIVVQSVSKVSQNTGMLVTNKALRVDAAAAKTNEGQRVLEDTRIIEGVITRLGSATGSDRTKLATEGRAKLDEADRYINNLIKFGGLSKENRKWLEEAQRAFATQRQQIAAALAPTASETKAQTRAEREAAKAEREAARGPKATQADLDGVGSVLGLAPGSGQRTRAQQTALFNAHKTRATADTSGHSMAGGAARDFPTGNISDARGEALAAAARKYYKDRGIDAFVKWENGRGKNNGTGPHIHTNLLPGARVGPKGAANVEAERANTDQEIARAGQAVDQRGFNNSIRDLRKGAGEAAVAASKAALDKLNDDLLRNGLRALGDQGIVDENDPRYKEAWAQIIEAQDQNTETFQQALIDGYVKTIEATSKAATAAFDRALDPARAALAAAQASAAGLDAYSLRNQVPDYVRTLAANRTAQATETLDRRTLATLPAAIAGKQNQIDNARGRLSTLDPESNQYTTLAAQIDTLTTAMAALQTQQTSLTASLGAGLQLPTTLAQSFSMAAEAFRSTHEMTNSFSQDLMMNMGSALETVNDGLTTMFTSILDGSQNALQAFGTFAKGIMQWMVQLAAKAVATQVINLLLNLAATAVGGSVSGNAPAGTTAGSGPLAAGPFGFTGGRMDDDHVIRRYGGGSVENGSPMSDSVDAKIAKGEWVVQKRAVDSVGNKFMARLNQHGAKALDSLQTVPQLDMQNHLESNIYVVPQGQVPQLGPNDVKVILNEELMNGDSKRLIEHISRSSR